MRKLIAVFVFCACFFVCINVYAGGYIIELKEDAPFFLLNENENITPLGDGGNYFYAENLEDALAYESVAANICEDFELELFDYPETTNDTYFAKQWNHPAMKAEAVRARGLDGSGVKIAVIDSGINIYHEDLKPENIFYTYDFISETEDFEAVNDTYGHGSFVSGTIAAQTNNGLGIAGIAPEARFAIFRVTDGSSFSASNLTVSIEKAIEQGCDVINMSLGAPGNKLANSQIEFMESLLNKAYEKNILVIAAVGNNSSSITNYPAGLDTVVGVGAVTSSLTRSSFSNYNKSVFVTAPGSNLYGITCNGSSEYRTWQGTSFSTPEVSAAAAIAKQRRSDITSDEFMELLRLSATDLGTEGYDIYYGYGLLNFEGLLEKMDEMFADMEPLEKYKNDVKIERRLSGGKLSVTLKPYGDTDFSSAKMYVCSYSGSCLDSIQICKAESDGNGLICTADVSEEKHYKIFIWNEDLVPVVMPFEI